MSIRLPDMVSGDGIKKQYQVVFGSYNHTLGARDGDIWDMKNMTGDYYPLLSPRKKRYTVKSDIEDPHGMFCYKGVYYVSGTGLFKLGDGEKGTLTGTDKVFAAMGDYIVILPDKAYYNVVSGEFGSIESCAVDMACNIKDGEYAGENAKANTIEYTGTGAFEWGDYFNVGDAVEIESGGKSIIDGAVIIREIEGEYLRFYENTFAEILGNKTSLSKTLTIRRTMPDLAFICESGNRLWGCKGDTIYASKLGDIFNWNVFDGLSTDSYACPVRATGDFTGCISFLGYPVFFTEERIFKVYGDKPSNFQLISSATLGVMSGSAKSLAVAGEMLFYLSRAGIVAYSGGIPQSVSSPFGDVKYKNAVGGSDGVKYYVSMEDYSEKRSLFVFDTRSNLWHKEDGLSAVGFGWDDNLYALAAGGNILIIGDVRSVPAGAVEEEAVESFVEFADITDYSSKYPSFGANKKGTGKLHMRFEIAGGAKVTISIKFDSSEEWETVKVITGDGRKQSYYLPIIPRRSDHYRIRIDGKGDWKLYSMAREEYNGSEL